MPVVTTAENVVTTPCVADRGPVRWPDPDIVTAVEFVTAVHHDPGGTHRAFPCLTTDSGVAPAGSRGWRGLLRSPYSNSDPEQETVMHPCHACGYTEIDPAGYCKHCRAHQGAVSYESDPPPVDSPQVVLPAVELPPVELPPVELPAHPPPAPARHPALMPLFVLTVIALLLTSGTLVVLVVHSGALKAPRVENAAKEPTKAPLSPSAT